MLFRRGELIFLYSAFTYPIFFRILDYFKIMYLQNQNNFKACFINFVIMFTALLFHQLYVRFESRELTSTHNDFQLIEGFESIIPNLANSLKKDSEINDFMFLSEQSYMKIRNKHLRLAQKNNKALDVWTDKLQTKTCFDGVEEGIQFTPTVCAILVEFENSFQFDDVWQKQIKPNLIACISSYAQNFTESFELIFKPNHLTSSIGLETVTVPENKDWLMFIFGDLEELFRENYYLDKQLHEYITQKKNYDFARPGIIAEPFIEPPFMGIFKDIGEIRCYIIFGRVEVLQFMGTDCYMMYGPEEALLAQYHRTHENIWEANKIPENLRYKYNTTKFESMQDKCLKPLMKNFDLTKMVPKIEIIGKKLHMDLVRVDIFPLTEDTFYVNEIEIDSDLVIVGYEEYILKKYIEGYERNNHMMTSFITLEDAKKEFDENCFN